MSRGLTRFGVPAGSSNLTLTQDLIALGYDRSRDLGGSDRSNYDLFVNRIAEDAACGGTPTQCVR